MGVGTLAAFVLLELALCLVPGPAVLLTLSTALRRGVRGGLAAATGVLAGNALYFALSGLGVVAVLLASQRAFTVVKWAGAAYLALLGVRALFARHAPPLDAGTPPRGGEGRAVLAGFVTQAANPKAIVFFAAILPQFVDVRHPVVPQLLALGIASLAVELAVLGGYSAAADRLRRTQAATRAALWIERAGGAVLLAVAARIAAEPLAP